MSSASAAVLRPSPHRPFLGNRYSATNSSDGNRKSTDSESNSIPGNLGNSADLSNPEAKKFSFEGKNVSLTLAPSRIRNASEVSIFYFELTFHSVIKSSEEQVNRV